MASQAFEDYSLRGELQLWMLSSTSQGFLLMRASTAIHNLKQKSNIVPRSLVDKAKDLGRRLAEITLFDGLEWTTQIFHITLNGY